MPTHTDGRSSNYEEHKSKLRRIILWMMNKLKTLDKWMYNEWWWY